MAAGDEVAEAEELVVEPAEDEIEFADSDQPDTSRVTEPFPFPPAKGKSDKPSQDQWGFLGGK